MKVFLVVIFVGVSLGAPSLKDEASASHENSVRLLGLEKVSSTLEGLGAEITLTGVDVWRQAALAYLNALRARASLPPLKLDVELNKMSQEWAEKNTCTGLHHDTPDMDAFYAENLAGCDTEISGNDKSKMAIDGIQRWYDEFKNYDCRKWTMDDMKYYGKVGHYMNSMSRKYNVVGFGLAMCPGKTTGQLVARFNGKDGFVDKMQDEEMKKQGITYDTFSDLDESKYVPCPNIDFIAI